MARVMVIDDNEDIRVLYARVLEMDGHTVTEATGGREGVAMLADGVPADVVILDVQMPDMDGWETLTAIRSLSRGAALPVLLCTVKASEDDVARGTRSGCDAYLTKPFSIAALRETVADLLARPREDLEGRRLARGATAARKSS